MDTNNYKPTGAKEHVFTWFAKIAIWAEKKWPNFFSAPEDAIIDSYASSMTAKFNWLHGLIYPHFFEKINIEIDNIETIRTLSQNGTIVYVTKDIGQLEYNFFNYFFQNEMLPLPRFVNELSLWQWLRFSELKYIAVERAKRFAKYGPQPHPIASGYAGALIEQGNAAFIQLKSTPIFDDLYWYTPNQDPLSALLTANERTSKPIYLVPLHFLWNKRPEGSDGSVFNLLPPLMRRTIRFALNYKNRAVVKISEPIALNSMVANASGQTLPDRARSLRKNLLEIFHQEKKITTGPALKPRSWIIDEILQDQILQKIIYDVSLEKKSSVDDVKVLAKKYAEEIAADINYNYIEVFNRLVKFGLSHLHDEIIINQEGLASVKKAFAKGPVVLVPNHRSHVDYLLLSTILYEKSIAIPHVAAGMNLKFWPLGYIFKKCGAFFLRRTFAGNDLYRAVFKTYLKVLVKEGYCQEFFIEGTRSRTGKLLRARMGMLKMLTEVMQEGAAKELSFVPVSITYDNVPEQYKSEIEGETKKREKTTDLFKLRKFFRKKYGKTYVRFGEPVPFEPDVNKVANAIMMTLNREMVVTSTSLTATAILATPKRGISHDELVKNVEELFKYLNYKSASITDISIPEALQNFGKFLTVHDEFDPLCYEIKDGARTDLSYYKNNIIHFFVSASIIASIIIAGVREKGFRPPMEAIREGYLFCKDIFSHEFSFSTRMGVDEHIKKALTYLENLNINDLELYKGILTKYFEAYLAALVVCENATEVEEKELLKTITKYARHMLLLGQISRPEAISNPVYKNALDSFVAKGWMKKDEGRYLWVAEKKTIEIVKLKLEGLA